MGALGSRRAQEKRAEKLGAIAAKVRGPVGLDLGGETPAEIALEIVGEILAAHKKALGGRRAGGARPTTDPRPSSTIAEHEVQPVVGRVEGEPRTRGEDAEQPERERRDARVVARAMTIADHADEHDGRR